MPYLRSLLALLAFVAAVPTFAADAKPAAPTATAQPFRIGVIGTGNIGGSVATLWVKAGHEVLISSRHPEELKPLAASLGPKARVGTPREAAAFGDVVLTSVPWGALPQVGRDFAQELKGKVVLDTGNPYPTRDGDMAVTDRQRGTGVALREYLPGVRVVRAFNAINWKSLRSEAHRAGAQVAIPLAGDDEEALAIAARLVSEAGFDPVIVGNLDRAKDFDFGSPVYVKLLTAPELRAALGLPK